MTSIESTGDLERATGSPTEPSGGAVVRSLVWVVLVASLAANTVASLAGAATPVHLGLGVVTGTCAILLIVPHLRRRP